MPIARVRVPASTSNLGPGFDCLGLALELYNEVSVEPATDAPASALMAEAAHAFFTASGAIPFPFRIRVKGEVPSARGLGSSVTVRLGILMALNRLCGETLDRERLFELSARLEGHPDNAAAACFGGFVVVQKHGGHSGQVRRYDVDPALKVVLCVPDFEVQTAEARKVLPAKYRREEVVDNLSGIATIVAGFVSRDYRLLRGAFVDHLHQPYRQPLVPFLPDVVSAGIEAGALGGFLSGSGSTIACLTLEREREVAAAMLAATPPGAAFSRTVSVDNRGAQLCDDQNP